MSQQGQLRKQAARAKGIPVSPTEKYAVCVDGLVRIVNMAAKNEKVDPIQLAGIAMATLQLVGLNLIKKENTDVGTDKTTTA